MNPPLQPERMSAFGGVTGVLQAFKDSKSFKVFGNSAANLIWEVIVNPQEFCKRLQRQSPAEGFVMCQSDSSDQCSL